jgi:uncharacterized protein YmfQ (DUF2313 family)
MAVNIGVAGYKESLRSLMPPGAAWKGDNFLAFIDAFATELARFEASTEYLRREVFPETSEDLLTDWERVAGLPDADFPLPTDLVARRNTVTSRLSIITSPTKAELERMALAGGFVVRIDETAVASTGALTGLTATPVDGSTFKVGIKTYTFKATLGTTEGQVLIGGSLATALTHAAAAVNHKGTPGTDYYCAAANTLFRASASSTVLTLTARLRGVVGNGSTYEIVAGTGSNLTASGALATGGVGILFCLYITTFTGLTTDEQSRLISIIKRFKPAHCVALFDFRDTQFRAGNRCGTRLLTF